MTDVDPSLDQYVMRRPTEADHARIAPVLNTWWGGRNMQDLLPRLFFQHFTGTSTVAETSHGDIAGFLVGFVSQDDPKVGYIHFVGVHPDHRGTGLGALLYGRAFDDFRARGCNTVKAVTSPVNTGSLAFHAAMGFTRIADPSTGAETWPDYDGPGGDRVVLSRSLSA